MFESTLVEEAPVAGVPVDEDWFDPAWLDQVPGPEDIGQVPVSVCAPSGWLALELDHGTVDPGRLSDAELIDSVVGFDRVASWAGARQASLLAEFARRRPSGDSPPSRSDVAARYSGFAPDEIALALHLSRTSATARLVMAQTLVADLPATLAAWEAGTIDVLKARAIAEAAYLLTPRLRGALEARVLSRAGTQTLSRLRAGLARAVLVIDPEGAAERFQRRRDDRRVVLSPEGDAMASLWALLSAPDATAAYQRLCRLARDLGADDPRGMDARRADLLTDLLTGRRCAATTTPLDHPDHPEGCDCTPTTADPTTADPDGATRNGHDCASTRSAAGPGKPLISVIVPITTLMGLDEQPGELVGHGPIPAPLAREIATEGTWRRLLTEVNQFSYTRSRAALSRQDGCGRTCHASPAPTRHATVTGWTVVTGCFPVGVRGRPRRGIGLGHVHGPVLYGPLGSTTTTIGMTLKTSPTQNVS